MSKKQSDWCIPEEVLGLLSTIFLAPGIAVLTSLLFPAIEALHSANITRLFAVGLGVGTSSIVLLFFARLPLYRERRFWTFGPRELDRNHRRLYWLAHLFLVASIIFLVVVWFRLR
jgi:hypothetical protein